MKNKALFLDRDGILNIEKGRYTSKLQDFEITPGIINILKKVKKLNFLLIVVTNQAGISKKLYTRKEVDVLHQFFQQKSGNIISQFYIAPEHPDYTSESLSRKPESLLFEKAIAKFNINPFNSWMIGDNERDLIPAKKLGIKTIYYNLRKEIRNLDYADRIIRNIEEVDGILEKNFDL